MRQLPTRCARTLGRRTVPERRSHRGAEAVDVPGVDACGRQVRVGSVLSPTPVPRFPDRQLTREPGRARRRSRRSARHRAAWRAGRPPPHRAGAPRGPGQPRAGPPTRRRDRGPQATCAGAAVRASGEAGGRRSVPWCERSRTCPSAHTASPARNPMQDRTPGRTHHHRQAPAARLRPLEGRVPGPPPQHRLKGAGYGLGEGLSTGFQS